MDSKQNAESKVVSKPSKAEPKVIDFRILTVNDVYTFSSVNGHGGYAQLATVLKKHRRDENCIFSINGDFLGGSAMAEKYQGKPALDVVRYLRPELLVIGNHEFDYGAEVLAEHMRNTPETVWLGANILDSSTHALFASAQATTMVTAIDAAGNAVKVGFFGVCTVATPRLSYPGEAVCFVSVEQTARQCVQKLKQEGAEVIVAVTHVPFSEDKFLAKNVKDIDVIIGGHDHDPLCMDIDGTLVFKAGQNAYWLGQVDLRIEVSEGVDGKKRKVKVYPSWSMKAIKGYEEDEGCLAIIDRWQRKKDQDEQSIDKTEVVVTIEGQPLVSTTAMVRCREASFANMVADAMFDYYRAMEADIGCINGGFIRADSVYPPGTELTVGHILEELPFPRHITLIAIKGSDLLEAMEQQLRFAPAANGCFPHYSQHVRLVYDSRLAAGRRIQTVHINNEPLHPNKTYRLALTEFMAGGGDECLGFTKGTRVHGIASCRVSEVLLLYLRHAHWNKRYTPLVQHRSIDLADDARHCEHQQPQQEQQ